MAAATTYRVAVGLLKSDPEVTITLPPDADWDAAKRAACEAAGADPTTHRLLFRGREPSGGYSRRPRCSPHREAGPPRDGGVQARPRESRRGSRRRGRSTRTTTRFPKPRANQSRRRRAWTDTTLRITRVGVESNATLGPRGGCSATVSATEAKLCALEEEVAAAERRAAAASGVAGAMDPTPPPDDRTFLYLADRLEKAMVTLDGVDASGDEG